MRISVVIPAMNEEPLIGLACDHALRLGAHEVIVADGGSTDQTRAIAQGRGCVVVESATGRGVQQNAAARQASGDVLLFLHADTWLVPEAPRQLVDALQDPCVVAGAFRQRIEASGWRYRLLEQANALRGRWRQSPYGDQAIFVRREAFEQVGGFPEVPLLEDVYLMRHLRRVGKVVLLPGPLHVSARRWQRHGIVRQTLRNWSILAADRLGVAPQQLSRYYRRHDL